VAAEQLDGSLGECVQRIRDILRTARAQVLHSANATMVSAYWHIGREIVEEEQRGKERADYGARLMHQISEQLTVEFGRGYSLANVKLIRQFYLAYRNRDPLIGYTSSSQLTSGGTPAQKGYTACSQLLQAPPEGFHPELSWSHYRILMRVPQLEARAFYEVEAAKSRWVVRELERQIGSLLFERLANSRDKDGVLALARDGHEVFTPADLVKDPYVLEFTGLPEASRWLESDLEQALIDRLQQFILELGRDLFFVARQKRLTIDGDHFYIDLVFYHRVLRSFLLIDLKTGKLTHEDLGQMQMYVGWYEMEERREGEGPPIGLILCTSKNEAVVKYTLSQSASQVFASRYQLHLPSEEDLVKELRQERARLEQQLLGTRDGKLPDE
jgi:predicted nuclease of restriction endonuclease-like (RecB) superfamily